MNIEQAKSIPLTDVLSKMNRQPVRRYTDKLMYRSPLREDKSPSFCVYLKTNTWCDFGMDRHHGDVLDLVEKFANIINKSEQLRWLANLMGGNYVAPPLPLPNSSKLVVSSVQEVEYKVRDLTNTDLLNYLRKRGITQDVATRYCKEVSTWYKGYEFHNIGFPTRAGGYELRNERIKRSLGHKNISFVRVSPDKRTTGCCVFEGFMDFLSYVIFFRERHSLAQIELCDCLVLNSIINVNKALPELKDYHAIHCYLDNDEGGRAATQQIRFNYPQETVDESIRYASANDVNEYLMNLMGIKN